MNAAEFERNGPQGSKLVAYNRWLEDRPEHVRSVVAKYPPWSRYKHVPTGVGIGILNFSEVVESGVGMKKGDVLFNVKVIEVPRDRAGLAAKYLGKIVTGVKPEDLVILEPR